jgi:hypothetical protein
LERSAVDEAVSGLLKKDRSDLYYVVGRYLELRARPNDEVTAYYQECVKLRPGDSVGCLAACQRLRALQVPFERIPHP